MYLFVYSNLVVAVRGRGGAVRGRGRGRPKFTEPVILTLSSDDDETDQPKKEKIKVSEEELLMKLVNIRFYPLFINSNYFFIVLFFRFMCRKPMIIMLN